MPAAPRDWAVPFLEQAKADLAAAEFLASQGAHHHPSTLCMLIQMVFEKLAKAALRRGGEPIKNIHEVLGKFLPTLKAKPSLTPPTFTSAVERFILDLEQATPQIANKTGGEMLEYPWEDASRRVCWPARDLSLARQVASPADLTAAACLKCAGD